jgi:hypothetical protein
MAIESTSLFLGVCIGAASALVGLVPCALLLRRVARIQAAVTRARAARATPPAPAAPAAAAVADAAYATRLLLAQHWARGGLLSHEHEAWRPIVTAVALAALAVEDLDALDELLRACVASAGTSDPALANVWRQALGELQSARADHELSGLAIDKPEDWPFPALRVRSRELLQSAQLGAERLVSASH